MAVLQEAAKARAFGAAASGAALPEDGSSSSSAAPVTAATAAEDAFDLASAGGNGLVQRHS